jgi:hypothetical protein
MPPTKAPGLNKEEVEFRAKFPIASLCKAEELRKSEAIQQADTTLRDAITKVESLIISDDDTMKIANESLAIFKKLDKELEDLRLEKVKPHNDWVKGINSDFKFFTQRIEKGISDLTIKMRNYARDLERKQQEEARKREEEERKRREEEEARLKAEQEEAAKAGMKVPVAPLPMLDDDDDEMPVPAPQQAFKPIQTASGSTTWRDNWVARVDNLKTLVDAVAAGNAPLSCLKADESFLSSKAKEIRADSPYAGVSFSNEKIPVTR